MMMISILFIIQCHEKKKLLFVFPIVSPHVMMSEDAVAEIHLSMRDLKAVFVPILLLLCRP